MKKSLWNLLPAIFWVFLTQSVFAEFSERIAQTSWKAPSGAIFTLTKDGICVGPNSATNNVVHTYKVIKNGHIEIAWGNGDGYIERKKYVFDTDLKTMTCPTGKFDIWSRVDLASLGENQKTAPAIEPVPNVAVSNISPLELLAQEGPNLIAWVTSPLDVDVPDDFRASISLLREDMLDGHAEKGKETGMYAAGAVLCDNLISSLDMKERRQIEAKLKVAQAKERAPLSNQALEARRNYMMSWPQYEREVRQREALSEKKGNTIEVKTRELEAKWIVRAGELRKALDGKYAKFRASIREK